MAEKQLKEEELKQLKKEYEVLKNKLQELSEDELKHIIGGNSSEYFNKPDPQQNGQEFEPHIYPSTDPKNKNFTPGF